MVRSEERFIKKKELLKVTRQNTLADHDCQCPEREFLKRAARTEIFLVEIVSF